MARITLCSNCLTVGHTGDVPVGHEKGSQRDPYHDTVSLCEECATLLLTSDFTGLAKRNRTSVTINKEDL